MEIKFGLIDFLLVAPAVSLFLASCIPLATKVMRGNSEHSSFYSVSWGYIGVVAAIIFTLPTVGSVRTAFEGALVFDGISHFVTLLILGVTAVALTFLRDSQSTNGKLFSENVFLILNAAVGMLTMAWSNDLIVVFVGLELFSLCLYMLIALSLEDKLSKEAAFKYFILGSFASALMLYGISFVFGTVGTTYLPDLLSSSSRLVGTNLLFSLGFVLLLVGLFFKISIFPFHSWAPDVYQGSPTPLTSFMATTVKAVSFALLLRLMTGDTFNSERFFPFVDTLQWITMLTIVVGNVGAFRQQSLKRMLAYSSIAHSGYLMIGIIAAGIQGAGASMLGASGVMFYLLAYSVMTLGAFGVLHLLEPRPDADLTVKDLRGLGKSKPLLALVMTVLLLSLTGIPPTIGFFGKLFLFSAAVKQGLIWLTLWGVVGSIISVYYYLRPIVAMYMEDADESVTRINLRSGSYFTVAVMALMVIVVGLTANSIYDLVLESVAKVF